MKAYATLPLLIERFIFIKLLKKKPLDLTIELEENPILGTNLKQDDPCTIPFNVYYYANHISDGFYTSFADVDQSLDIPPRSIIKICDWDLISSDKITLIIKKMQIISSPYPELKFPTIPIERNVRVCDALHLLRYNLIKEKTLLALGEPPIENVSENDAESINSDAPDSQIIIDDKFEKPIFENYQKPVPLGIGPKSKDIAESFKSSRAIISSISSQDDLVSALAHKKFQEKSPSQQKQQETATKSNQQSTILVADPISTALKEINMMKFPFWALEYLSIIYKQ